MSLIYIITKFICFPGAYLRGFWEHLTCKILKLQVEPIGYLRADEASGHVEHSLAKGTFSSWLMATGPSFMNFNMGLFFFLFGFINLKYMGITPWDSVPMFIVYVIAMYIGISMLCCVFPLREDILNYWSIAYGPYGKKGNLLTGIMSIIAYPLAVITRIGAFLESKGIIFLAWIVYIVLEFTLFK